MKAVEELAADRASVIRLMETWLGTFTTILRVAVAPGTIGQGRCGGRGGEGAAVPLLILF